MRRNVPYTPPEARPKVMPQLLRLRIPTPPPAAIRCMSTQARMSSMFRLAPPMLNYSPKHLVSESAAKASSQYLSRI